MEKRPVFRLLAITLCVAFVLSGCGATATPTPLPAKPTAAPTQAPTAAPTAAAPCLIVGALYGGPINDAGYNQAMHEAVVAIKSKITCVKIIEAENVPDEAGATTTMVNMIQQGAKLIFATAFNHQYPALELSKKNPTVIFEHAGGWEMGANFANFFGKPPDSWYTMGVAAAKMTTSKKLGFVAAFPQAWTLVFANAFELGARSVNPDIKTIIAYTFSWGDRAKEADTTNALINQGVDVITMHVDSPATVISTAESRGTFSIGFQSLAAQQFAPQNWITGTGYTLGGKLIFLASTVLDGTWKPIFLRCGTADGCMAMAPFGPKVPKAVQDQVLQTKADLEAGKIVVFKGPIKDQAGNVKVAEGAVLTDDKMGAVDWLVEGVIGNPK